jgi:hypothetical protein
MNKYIFILFFSVIYIYSPNIVKSDDIKYRTLGLRVGTSNYNERDFRSLEIDSDIGLPFLYEFHTTPDLSLKPIFSFSAGGLKQNRDIGYLFTLTSGVALFALNKKAILDIAGGGALITEDRIGGHNFGGPFQFSAHGGLAYKITNRFLLGYRFYHISDAGLNNGNGLNRHLLELSVTF